MLFFVAVTAAAGLYRRPNMNLEIIFAAVADAYIQVSTFVARSADLWRGKISESRCCGGLAAGYGMAGSHGGRTWRNAGLWRRGHCCHPVRYGQAVIRQCRGSAYRNDGGSALLLAQEPVLDLQ